MIEEHNLRSKIYSQLQHPFKHTLGDFSYSNPAFTGTTIESALNWIFAVLYPNTQAAVATPGDLPTVGNTINDYRVVLDDGDGKAASYRWEQREGDVAAQWYKIYDMDWGEDSILSNFLVSTQGQYVYKQGISDTDENGDVLTGELAGQHVYGGDLANQHLTLHANSGDGTGAQTGWIQFGDDVRPTTNNADDLGDATHGFRTGYFGTSLLVSDLTLSAGSIVSSSGAISFGDENLSTTGTLSAGVTTINGQAVMQEIATPGTPAAGFNSLYFKSDDKLYRLDSSANEKLVGLDFTSSNDNRLIRSNGTGGDSIQESGITVSDTDVVTGILEAQIGNLALIGNTFSSTNLNGDINLTPNGTGKVVLANLTLSSATEDKVLVADASGVMEATNVGIDALNQMTGLARLDVDNVRMDGLGLNVTLLNGDLQLQANGTGLIRTYCGIRSNSNGVDDLGVSGARWNDLFLSGGISDGTNEITMATLLSFRDALVSAADGHALFYNSASGKWLSSLPDSEVSHGGLAGLSSDDHSQYLLLAGRSGGQEIFGSTDASEDLLLNSTSHATKGAVKTKDNFVPFTDASYSTQWDGTDLGGSSNNFRHLYSKGEFFGLRLQNVTSGTLPGFSANNKGRMVWSTDDNTIYVDTGAGFTPIAGGAAASKKYAVDQTFNGVDLTKTVDVSSVITDARTCVVQLLDNTNNYERIYCDLEAISTSQVRITTNVALPAGSYRLVVME